MSENKPIEALKVAYSQVKDGDKLVLVIHPNDMPDWLRLLGLGKRIAFAAVPITDEEQEHGQGEKVKRGWDKLSLAEQAGIRCNEAEFSEWLVKFDPQIWKKLAQQTGPQRDAIAAAYVRYWCRVESRALVLRDTIPGHRWLELDQRYREETGQLTEQRS